MEGREWWCWAIVVICGQGSLLAMCIHLASVGSCVHGWSSFIGGGSSSSRGGALSLVGWSLFVPFVGAGSLLVGIWVSFVSGGALLHAAHIVRRGGLMFVGDGCGLWVLSSVCGRWVVVCGCWVVVHGCWVVVCGCSVVVCGCQGVICGRYASFACSIRPSWVGTDVQGCGCSVVVCGHIGAMVCVVSCVMLSLLVRTDGTKINNTYLHTTMTKDEIIIVHCLVATSLSVMWQLEAPIPLIGFVTWRCNVIVAEVAGMGDGWEW